VEGEGRWLGRQHDLDFLAAGDSWLQGDVHLHDSTAELVDHGDRGGLGDLLYGEAGRLKLLSPEPVPGYRSRRVSSAAGRAGCFPGRARVPR
jgi:hypothetical protein